MKNVYLESLPLKNIAKYRGNRQDNALPFSGCPKPHPSERDKLIFLHEPTGTAPKVMEFRIEDVLSVEDIPSVVTETGEGIPLVRLWIRKGARGTVLKPFEVDNPIKFVGNPAEICRDFLQPGPTG